MIECQDITKIYKIGDLENKALNKASFKIEDGEFVAIMGPSGSGKSTLMHILGCLDIPTSGNYFFEGKNISKLTENELANIRRDKIGFVFQSFNLLPRTTVLRNVALPLIYAGVLQKERVEKAKEALKAVAFPEEFWNYYPNQLSGGMMQRVAIARALISNPNIILADEPTGNLDSKTGEVVLEAFQKLNDKGHTVVLITHDKYIAQTAKRIISLKDGEIIEDSKTAQSQTFKEAKE
jgi:putative ABC transport system ATP-binding protein